MQNSDLAHIAALLGNPEAMRYYPAPKTRDEAQDWIDRMRHRYVQHGFGLWAVETHAGEFVGDCGLTWQEVNGRTVLEVGYHVMPALQGRGFATEAARACVDEARRRFEDVELTAIIHPENYASRRVAEKLGMAHAEDDHGHDWILRTVMSMRVH